MRSLARRSAPVCLSPGATYAACAIRICVETRIHMRVSAGLHRLLSMRELLQGGTCTARWRWTEPGTLPLRGRDDRHRKRSLVASHPPEAVPATVARRRGTAVWCQSSAGGGACHHRPTARNRSLVPVIRRRRCLPPSHDGAEPQSGASHPPEAVPATIARRCGTAVWCQSSAGGGAWHHRPAYCFGSSASSASVETAAAAAFSALMSS